PGRPLTGRGERAPLSPAGSRRPPLDRSARPVSPLVHQQGRGGGTPN
ncbi:hypothetical protein GA0115240_10231, partial [Streptomyces sp. DvalAA-14]